MISPFFTLVKAKLPSKSVIAPLVVPFTITEAPIMDSPVASFTIPLHVSFCCTIAEALTSEAVTAEMVPVENVPKNNNMLTDFSRFNIILNFKVFD